MHLEVIFQLVMYRIDADTTHVVCTSSSGLEIEFSPIWPQSVTNTFYLIEYE